MNSVVVNQNLCLSWHIKNKIPITDKHNFRTPEIYHFMYTIYVYQLLANIKTLKFMSGDRDKIICLSDRYYIFIL